MVYTVEVKDPKKQLVFYKESYPKILKKLKEYEDTGLSPREVELLKSNHLGVCNEL